MTIAFQSTVTKIKKIIENQNLITENSSFKTFEDDLKNPRIFLISRSADIKLTVTILIWSFFLGPNDDRWIQVYLYLSKSSKHFMIINTIQIFIIKIDVNTAIWLVDPPKATFVILDRLGWYCDFANIFILQRQIQIVPWNNRTLNQGIITFCCYN